MTYADGLAQAYHYEYTYELRANDAQNNKPLYCESVLM
jgi:hypothetical protein